LSPYDNPSTHGRKNVDDAGLDGGFVDIDHRTDCVNGSLGLVASRTSVRASSEVVDPSSDVVHDGLFDKCPAVGLRSVSDSWSNSDGDDAGLDGGFVDIDHRSDCVNGSFGLVALCTCIEASSEVVDPSSDVVHDPGLFDKSQDAVGLGDKRPFHHGRFVNIDCQSACVIVCFGLDAPCTSINS
jgi:hypothetical protein